MSPSRRGQPGTAAGPHACARPHPRAAASPGEPRPTAVGRDRPDPGGGPRCPRGTACLLRAGTWGHGHPWASRGAAALPLRPHSVAQRGCGNQQSLPGVFNIQNLLMHYTTTTLSLPPHPVSGGKALSKPAVLQRKAACEPRCSGWAGGLRHPETQRGDALFPGAPRLPVQTLSGSG